MIKMMTAYTDELDDPDLAIRQVLEGLRTQGSFLSYTVGILTCYAEYVETGVVAALCDSLPFDVVGCTTLGCGTQGESGMMLLCLTVLTSDEVQFSTASSAPFEEGVKQVLAATYDRAAAELPGPPSCAFAFFPLILDMGGESMLEALQSAVGEIPIFGTGASDHTLPYYTQCVTIHNGAASRRGAALLLAHGQVNPRFFVTAVSENHVQKQRGIVTKAEGNVLMEINGLPVLEYFKNLGISDGSAIVGMASIPLLIDYGDGAKPAARSIYSITPEGYVVCGAAMPVGATVFVGSIDYEDVMATAARSVKQALESEPAGGILMFPCLSRNTVLGADVLAEMDAVSRCMEGTGLPYLTCYSGGEYCPVYAENGKLVNRFHNFSFVICAL